MGDSVTPADVRDRVPAGWVAAVLLGMEAWKATADKARAKRGRG